MLPIYVMYDSGLSAFEQKCVKEAMVDFKELFPERDIVLYGSRAWSDGDYSSADWYVRNAKMKLRPGTFQLDAASILSLMETEPWQETPHVDVFFTSKDLTAKGLNFCFGMTRGRCTVQSVHRYRQLYPEDRKLAIKAVVLHELGHVFGLATGRQVNVEYRLGYHCTSFGCVMQQGMNLSEWVRHAREAKRVGMIYCPYCMKDMRRSKI